MSKKAITIEDLGKDNGTRTWSARDISNFLGYATYNSFVKVINRAIASAGKIDIDILEEFIPYKRQDNTSDYKLTRFALLLCVQNADRKKENVNKAQTYLSAFASAMFEEQLARIEHREDLKTNEKSMINVAVGKGLNLASIGLFHNAGYRGMYNMNLKALKRYKNFDEKGTMLDYMNSVELAANNLRVELTKDRLKTEQQTTERQMLSTAEEIGKDIRDVVIKNTSVKPEDMKLPFCISECQGSTHKNICNSSKILRKSKHHT